MINGLDIYYSKNIGRELKQNANGLKPIKTASGLKPISKGKGFKKTNGKGLKILQ